MNGRGSNHFYSIDKLHLPSKDPSSELERKWVFGFGVLEDLFDRSRFASLLIDFLEFIEVLLQFEKAVPVGIIRGSHHRTLSGPSSLMMPEVVESDLEFIDPGIFLQQVFIFKLWPR